MSTIVWKESHEFRHIGHEFTVVVKGWDEGKRWNVYIYIYPGNRWFLQCKESMMGCPVPLGGESFFKLHRGDNGAITSYQYGNDYNHIWQEGYSPDFKKHCAFQDAENVIEFLSPEKESAS